MEEIKIGSIWTHKNGLNYAILEVQKDDVIAMTDPSIDLDKDGYFWRGDPILFVKEFKHKSS